MAKKTGASVDVCFNKIVKSKGLEKFSKGELRDLVQQIADLREQGGVEALSKRVENYKKYIQLLESQQQVRRAQDIAKRSEAMKFLDSFQARHNNMAEGLLALLGGSVHSARRGGLSIAADYSHIRRSFMSKLSQMLDNEQLSEVFESGKFDREIMQEMWEPGSSGNKEAARVGEILRMINDGLWERMHESGVKVGKIHNFIMTQTHNVDEMIKVDGKTATNRMERAKARSEWVSFIYKSVDHEKTFTERGLETKSDQFNYLNRVYDQFVKGEADADIESFVKTRKIHFKDGDAYFRYNEKYGKRALKEGILNNISNAARITSKTRVLGSKPRQAFDDLLNYVESRDPENFEKMSTNKAMLEAVYDEVTGANYNKGRSVWARRTRALLNLNASVRLGKAWLSSMPDWPMAVEGLKSITGEGVLPLYMKTFQDYAKHIVPLGESKANRRLLARRMQLFTDDLLAMTYDKLTIGADSRPGELSSAAHFTMKWSGLANHTEVSKLTVALHLGRTFAELADRGKAFSELGPDMRAKLSHFGIDELDWDIMTNAIDELNSQKFITPEKIAELSDSEIREIAGERGLRTNEKGESVEIPASELRANTERKLGILLGEWADTFSLQAGAREKAMFRRVGSEDSFIGLVVRMALQFKGVALSATKAVRTVGYAGADDSFNKMAVARMMGSLTMLGYISMSLKAISEGETPPDPTNGDVLRDAFLKGGSGGIWADIFANESYRGTDIWSNVAGPSVDTVNDLFKTVYATSGAVWDTAFESSVKARKSREKAFGTALKTLKQDFVPMGNAPLGVGKFWELIMVDVWMDLAYPGWTRKRDKRRKKWMEERGQENFMDDVMDSF